MQYSWPGNVRELENAIERAAILARDGQLRFDLPGTAREILPRRPERSIRAPLTEAQRRAEDRANIVAALEAADGRIFGVGGAAELLGLPPTTLISRMKKLDIPKPERRR